MKDIFDAIILCPKCNNQMKPVVVSKNGSQLRAIQCASCNEQIIHPTDLNAYKQFNSLKGKTYCVKLRMVGNSHTISIPKEIVNFIRTQEKIMDNMVNLCLEDFHRLSLRFGTNRKIQK